MSLFSLYKNHHQPSRHEIDDALTGNLCRCTGYKPIVEAAAKSCVHQGMDSLSTNEHEIAQLLRTIDHTSATIETKTQTYFQPTTLLEALKVRHQYPEAIIICGATDIALRVTKKHELLAKILDLSFVDELKTIREENDSLRIGASVALSDVHSRIEKTFPALADMFNVFGSLQIRNLATLGGNLGSASPIGDTLSALIPYDARIVLQSVSGKREVPLRSYVTGYRKTVRNDDELVVEVILPKPKPKTLVKWYKVSKRKDLDISTVSAGFRLELDETNQINSSMLAYGGMAERVKQATTAENFLHGKPWTSRRFPTHAEARSSDEL
jgi:xanthine dehydrogenase small subunit